MEVSVITPTRDRPKAFRICRGLMSRQSIRGAIQWIVVDDGDIPIEDPGDCHYLRRPPSREKNTLPLNLLLAAPEARGNHILIMEDDDFYPPDYCESMSMRLRKADACGEIVARYYNVKSRRWNIGGDPSFSSLCRLGFRKEKLGHLIGSAIETKRAGDVSVDKRFWERIKQDTKNIDLFREPKLSVSIKGLPGRPGLGRNHADDIFPNVDPQARVLENWVGKEYADIYSKAVFK